MLLYVSNQSAPEPNSSLSAVAIVRHQVDVRAATRCWNIVVADPEEELWNTVPPVTD